MFNVHLLTFTNQCNFKNVTECKIEWFKQSDDYLTLLHDHVQRHVTDISLKETTEGQLEEDDGYTPPQEDYLPPGLHVSTLLIADSLDLAKI